MKKNRTTLLVGLISLLFISTGSVFAQSKVGISSAAFLGIGAGPKALSLGSANVAIASDASSIYWNPGAIAQLNQSQLLFSNIKWFLGTKINYFGAVIKLDNANTLGVSFYNLDYGDEKVTTVEEQTGTGEYWSASDMTFGLSYSRLLTDRFSLGGSLKYIQSKIWHEAAQSVAVDVGLLFKTQLDGVQIGMSIANYGTDMQFDGSDLYQKIDIDPDALGNNETLTAKMKTDSWSLPLFFRIGIAYSKDFGNFSKMTFATDAFVPSDNEEQINLGFEWAFFNQFALRVGYKGIGYEDSQEGLTFGGGINYRISNVSMLIDYSYQDFEFFNDIQSFSIGMEF